MNENNRRTLRALLDILSDAHLAITEQGASVNGAFLKLDESIEASIGVAIYAKRPSSQIDTLIALLQEQAQRCIRIAEELETVKNNVKVP
jgi:hypothetical protein